MGQKISKNIIKGIFTPDTTLLFDMSNKGVAYLLLETICIAFLGTLVGSIFSNPICVLICNEYRSKASSINLPYSNHGHSYGTNSDLRINVYPCNWTRSVHRIINDVCSINRDDSKLYIEAIEDLDYKILESLDASGCNLYQKIRFGILPQLIPSFYLNSDLSF